MTVKYEEFEFLTSQVLPLFPSAFWQSLWELSLELFEVPVELLWGMVGKQVNEEISRKLRDDEELQKTEIWDVPD